MAFLPHQQRVIDEKKELDEKATKLSVFIGMNPMFESIAPEEQERMKEQCEIMWQYSEVLGKRIAAFEAYPANHVGNTASSLYELLAKVAPWVPVCKPELHQEVQSALDAGISEKDVDADWKNVLEAIRKNESATAASPSAEVTE
jgi:hypothetical protein